MMLMPTTCLLHLAMRSESLAKGRFHGIGVLVAEMEPQFREWVIAFGTSGYTVLYRLAGDLVVLLTIRHGRELGY